MLSHRYHWICLKYHRVCSKYEWNQNKSNWICPQCEISPVYSCIIYYIILRCIQGVIFLVCPPNAVWCPSGRIALLPGQSLAGHQYRLLKYIRDASMPQRLQLGRWNFHRMVLFFRYSKSKRFSKLHHCY